MQESELEPGVLSLPSSSPIWPHNVDVLGFGQLTVCLPGHIAWPCPASRIRLQMARGPHAVDESIFQ